MWVWKEDPGGAAPSSSHGKGFDRPPDVSLMRVTLLSLLDWWLPGSDCTATFLPSMLSSPEVTTRRPHIRKGSYTHLHDGRVAA